MWYAGSAGLERRRHLLSSSSAFSEPSCWNVGCNRHVPGISCSSRSLWTGLGLALKDLHKCTEDSCGLLINFEGVGPFTAITIGVCFWSFELEYRNHGHNEISSTKLHGVPVSCSVRLSGPQLFHGSTLCNGRVIHVSYNAKYRVNGCSGCERAQVVANISKKLKLHLQNP